MEDIILSIVEYKNQLAQVEEALKICASDNDKSALLNLQRDLKELLELTQETLDKQQASASNENNRNKNEDEKVKVNSKDPFADEMRLFLQEVNNENSNQLEKTIINIKTELNELIGKKCLAPYIHSWGSSTYHNAFVCGLDDCNEYDEDDLTQVKVRVLFTNPTHREMVPCPYFLDGDCKFDADKCRYSHGELVPFDQLKEYKEPDFLLLSKIKCIVLAKQSDRIWYKGRIVSSNFELKISTIKLEQNSKEISCPFEDILPIGNSQENVDTSDSDDTLTDEDDVDDVVYSEMHQAYLIEKSLLTPATNQPLGEWEKHTKGFGSKMMQKYGYIIGNGLGTNGDGIIVPISAQILPPGRSLDHCMELREQANGDRDLFSVERKLCKKQKQQEIKNQRIYENQQQQSSTNVFSFINENILANIGTSSTITETSTASRTMGKDDDNIIERLECHSTKKLNLTGFKLAEDIRRKEREIVKIKESMLRHKNGTPMYTKLNEQLRVRTGELDDLKKTENCISNEQIFRKNKTKLSIF